MGHFWQYWKVKKYHALSENDKIEYFGQNWRSEQIHGPLRKWQNWAFLTKLKKRKNTRVSQEMTKLSIFWQKWRSEKIHGPLRKWQNWAFLTKLKKRKNTRVSQKMTKLSTFDKIEEAKKSTVLSQNDKIEHFWQNWRSEKIHEPLTKWQNGAFLTKIVWYITTHSVHIVYLCLSHNLKSTFQKWQNGPFLTKLKKWKKKYTFLSQKMTKLSIFDKIEEAKKYTSLSQNDKMGLIWQK